MRMVMEFFTVEGSRPIEIHMCLVNVHGDASSVSGHVSERGSGEKPCITGSVAHKDGRSVLIKKQTLWKKILNFVKDVPMIYVNFTGIVNTVPERKKQTAFLSYHPLTYNVYTFMMLPTKFHMSSANGIIHTTAK
jgi:hypothetical protein